ncbi:MAG TPA: hypothetical protein PKD95_02405 [Candidatus Paceibacterota bacterium]|nr:hypothetical protein [Candidatus Paceibacterota bacterium]
MKSKETGFVGFNDIPVENEELRGREAIPVEKALATQEDLIWYLTPPPILELIHEDESGRLLEALTLRYMNKYVNEALNGFTDFCNQRADDKSFIERVNNGELTTDDFEAMKQFLTNHPQGSQFFESEQEINDFIAQYKDGSVQNY